ncbi:MAG: bifunctional diguanylate cyclase/phosphodiesterase [Synergistetes bacterium]|nr:bifunctional diguanylate cyclase/phosphodiesterase [Synergistota bacterium]MDW8192331.1 bifunctional diguanylate cyclase/phosphodiesterase [Synergistota bacterium]
MHLEIANRLLSDFLRNASLSREGSLFLQELNRLLLNFLFYYALNAKERSLIEKYLTMDVLTGLLNRHGFGKVLSEEIEKRVGSGFGLLYLDLDNLSLINDMYGYALGDMILVNVAYILREEMSDATAIGRIGGDEFGIIFKNSDPSFLFSKASIIKDRVSSMKLELLVEEGISVTGSIGIARFPQDGKAMDDLLFAAELACSCAKRRGGSKVCFAKDVKREDFEVPVAFHEYFVLLQKALKEIDGVSALPYYQPVVDLGTGEIIGYEVLARIHREGKPLPAALFIETAEKTGLIFDLGRKIIEHAFAEKVVDPLRDKLIFINLSVREIENTETIGFLTNAIERYGVDPRSVVIEITEKGAARDLGAVISFVKELARLGIRLAIDDFGSGFSSFLYIRYLDPYFVKIAGNLVREITVSSRAKMIIEGIVRFFKGMSIEVIAEHVENAEMVEALKKLNVRYAQGFHLGKPSRTPKGS